MILYVRSFFSPGERRLLETLPEAEAAIVRELMETFDARLEEEPAPLEQATLFDAERIAA
jgi:hypothetical protein